MSQGLRATLMALADAPDDAQLSRDPVAAVHRYDDPLNIETAGLFASSLAYGRVAAFRPVVDALFDEMDRKGGPRMWVDSLDVDDALRRVGGLVHRWNRGTDLVLLAAGLQRLFRKHSTLGEALPADASLADALDTLVMRLRTACVHESGRLGLRCRRFSDLPRGVRTLLPRPADGSATKRLWMFLRWMIRPSTDGIDFGIWTSRSPSELIIPLDTHVARISRLVGLTNRNDAGRRTAEEITRRLAVWDPDDPVRFDFALAHLGISGGCRGTWVAPVCSVCPLMPFCRAVGSKPKPG